MSDFKETLRTAWKAAWDDGQVDALDAIMHPDYLLENADSGAVGTLADLKREVAEVRSAFPDLSTTLENIVVDGDEFGIFWTTTGTFSGSLRDVPPTGERLKSRGSIQGRLRDGLIVSERVSWDMGNLLVDVGVPALQSAQEGNEVPSDATGTLGLPNNDAMKRFNRAFVTGVTVVSTVNPEGKPLGLAVNAYASISLEPPLVLVCVQKTSSTYPALFAAKHLGISILSRDQRPVVDVFSTKDRDKFANIDWHAGPDGSPIIDGSAAAIEAEIKERFQAKTHTVFIARVRHVEVSDLAPMVYMAGKVYDGDSLRAL